MHLNFFVFILGISYFMVMLIFMLHKSKQSFRKAGTQAVLSPAESSIKPVFQSQSAPSQPHRFAIVTLVADPSYVPASQVLAHSMSRWKKSDTDLIALVPKIPTIKELHQIGLKAAGWTIQEVDLIKPPLSTFKHYQTTFTKLYAWSLDRYERVLYLDADFVSVKSQDELLRGIAPNIELAAVRDSMEGQFLHRFNSGLMSIRPNRSRFEV